MILKNFERDNEGNFILRPAGVERGGNNVLVKTSGIEEPADITKLRRATELLVPIACGSHACNFAHVYFMTHPSEDELRPIEVTRVALYCRDDLTCPFKNPPVSDNEPLVPAPVLPTLQAEATI
ncbi:MAG TPA: hypothetical protein PKD15_05200 [Candidatus Saccharibacteria bacterium]|jgi:hypothetical protein|nr:hypothetical protein [Candidatus Saccharibacteria bacterium]